MKLLLIDGTGWGYRAFYTGAVNFFNMLERIISMALATHVIFVFDDTNPGWRHALYPAYKGGRKKDAAAKEFIAKIATCLQQEGHAVVWGSEADDTIGTLAYWSPIPTVIASSDTDFWQLLSDKVQILWCGKHFSDLKFIDESDIRARYGIESHQYVDYVALCGEVSDNIPGVKGIGAKSATALLRAYGTGEAAFGASDYIPGALGKKLKAPEAMAQFQLSKTLAKITVTTAEDPFLTFNSNFEETQNSESTSGGNENLTDFSIENSKNLTFPNPKIEILDPISIPDLENKMKYKPLGSAWRRYLSQ